jgi:hypothetical protein
MRWNDILAEAARKLDDAQLRHLIDDPEVSQNARRVLEAEAGSRRTADNRPAIAYGSAV